MRRTLRALVALLALSAIACDGPRARPAIFGGPSTSQRLGAVLESDPCRASADPSLDAPSAVIPSVEPPWGARISKIEIAGAPHVPRDLVWAAVSTSVGSLLEPNAIARDVRTLEDLEALATVRVDTERTANEQVIVRYVLEQRRTIDVVTYRWPNPLLAGHWVPVAKGELYDPARIARMRIDLERNLVEEGNLDASVEERHLVKDEKVQVCFLVEPGTKYLIDSFAFTGNDHVPQAELTDLLHTHDHRVNEAGKPFREDLLETDLLYVSALYYDRGFLAVKVGPAQTKTAVAGGVGRITVEVPIQEGIAYRLRGIRFAGYGPAAEHAKRLGMKSGEIFNRSRLVEGIEKIKALHRSSGVEIEVTVETELNPTKGEVDLVFKVSRVKK